jgi:hypothetical protein
MWKAMAVLGIDGVMITRLVMNIFGVSIPCAVVVYGVMR